MPTGRAINYVRYSSERLKRGVQLKPPTEAHRAYIAAEGALIRWAQTADSAPDFAPHMGMPLEPGYHEEFDTDLQYLYLWSGAQDSVAHVYYYRSA